MKVFLCGSGLDWDISSLTASLSSKFVMKTSTLKLWDVMGSIEDENRAIAHVVSAMDLLSVACEQCDLMGCTMIAYDMPLFYGTNGQMLPYVMRDCEFNDTSRGICANITKSVYSRVGFDYVFRIGNTPSDEMLVESGLLDEGRSGLVSVSSWKDVSDILRMEGM